MISELSSARQSALQFACRSSAATPAPDRATDIAHKNIRPALLVVAGILPAEAADTPTGTDLLKSRCTICHGPHGSGKTPTGQKIGVSDLDSADVQEKSEAEVESIIAKGKNKMPAYEGKLTPEQISQVSAFIKTLSA